MRGERVGGPGGPDPDKKNFFHRAWREIKGWFKSSRSNLSIGPATSTLEPDKVDQDELPWYLNKSKYGGKPVLTLGAHNIKMPYIQRDEYGNDILENFDVFLTNTTGSFYNGIASMWNESMEGKEGASFMYEGDSDMESAVRHITRGKATAVEIEGLAAMAIIHKVSRVAGEGLTGKNWEFNPAKDVDMRGGANHLMALEEAFKRTGVPKELFEVTKWGKDVNGKSIPTEYKGPNGAQVNLDIPAFNNIKEGGVLGEGPHQPHVGYQTPGRKANRVRGHIFIDNVPASR